MGQHLSAELPELFLAPHQDLALLRRWLSAQYNMPIPDTYYNIRATGRARKHNRIESSVISDASNAQGRRTSSTSCL